MKYFFFFATWLAAFQASAQCVGDLILYVNNAASNGHVIVDIDAANVEDLASIQLGFTYDADILQLDSISDAGLVGVNSNQTTDGEIRVLWLFSPGDVPATLDDGSTLFSLHFTAIAPGSSAVQITALPNFPLEAANTTGVEVCLTVANDGYVTTQGSFVQGRVVYDENTSCTSEGSEINLANWLVRLGNDNFEFYDYTDADGFFSFLADTGSYTLTAIPPFDVWSFCENDLAVEVDDYDQTLWFEFLSQAAYSCPMMNVDISTPFLRRCFENKYYVEYCNHGTAVATNASIHIALDTNLVYVSSTHPNVTVTGTDVQVDLGDVGIGECGSFTVSALLPCENSELGQSHCTTAYIFPDTLCGPEPANWNGASVEVDGYCESDSVYFQIQNVGTGDMLDQLEFIVVEDDVMLQSGFYQLSQQESRRLSFEANGSTYRILAEQVENHPGMSNPTAALEGCVLNPDDPFSVGFIWQFQEDDQDPYISIDCHESIGSFDPNDKQALPLGYYEEHYVKPGTEIEYFIRFQNTGTDTAFKVVIVDTLSEKLDIETLQLGAFSHRYALDIEADRVLKFTFDNISLPDSNINEPASHGFLKFSILPQADLPDETMIHNHAEIFFDFNEGVVTNEVFHTVSSTFLDVSSAVESIVPDDLAVIISPNPVHGRATLLRFANTNESLDFRLYDIHGREVMRMASRTKETVLHTQALDQGIYFYTVTTEHGLVQSGKLIVY